MKTRSLLPTVLWLALAVPGFSQDLAGAAKALERYRTETAQPKGPDDTKSAREAFDKRAAELSGVVATLPPADAAQRWLALLEDWRKLPRDDARYSMGDDNIFSEMLSALPPPAAWDTLESAAAARPVPENGAAFHAALRAFTATLRGDLATARKALAEAKESAGEARSGASYPLRAVTMWLDAQQDDPRQQIERFEAQLKEAEDSGNTNEMGKLPDLVTLAGAARAEALLRRALSLPGADLNVETGKETRALAVRLATKMAPGLKRAPWGLIADISKEDLALYEALNRKFPRKEEDNDSYQREQAERIYLLGLIAQRRTADAVALAEAIAKRGDNDDGVFARGEIESLLQAGLPRNVAAFLRELLGKNPALPFWSDFIRISAQAGASPEALQFMREVSARTGLKPAASEAVREHLWSALVAADEVDAGGKLLREIVEARIAKLEAPPAAAARRGGSSQNPADTAGQLALKLAKLGSVLKNNEWLDSGMKAAREAIAKGATSGTGCSHLVAELAELLLDLNRFAEAETLLIEDWIRGAKEKTGGDSYTYFGARGCPVELAELYHRANRPADVLQLLAEASDWGAADIGTTLMQSASSGRPLGFIAAHALNASGRKDEARKVLAALLERAGGRDAAYTLLLEMGGADVAAQLDALAARDRFEERPLIWKAKLLLDAGNIAEAEKTVRAAIAIDPSDGEQGKGDRLRAYAVLGDMLEKKGDAAQAKLMRGAVQAIRLSEDADDWWEAGLLSRAIKMYEDSLAHFADAYCIQSRLALRYSELGDFAKAEEHYRRAYELMPDSFGRVESHCFGCEGAFSGERAQGIAEKVFTRLATEAPNKAQVFYLLGYLREQQGRYAEAAEQFQKAVALDPDYLNAWKNLSQIGRSVQLTRALREKAVLNLLRLDPLGRHGAPSFASYDTEATAAISDFRALWALMVEKIRLQPASDAKVFPLPASAAAIERREKAEQAAAGGAFSRRSYSRSEEARTPGELLGTHSAINQLAQVLRALAAY